MLRNKENIPSAQRADGTNLSSARPDLSEDFFTDSVLNIHATPTSRIPSPSPQKALQTKSRRARPTTKVPHLKHRASAPERGHLQPAPPLRRSKSPNSLRTHKLATPPQSRDGPSSSSPQWDIKSPPPQEFSDVYQQIADEEDLAATDRKSSDEESLPEAITEDEQEHDTGFDARILRQPLSESQPKYPKSPRALTATQATNGIDMESPLRDHTETASDPTGMSFVNGLTDQELKNTLTPHFSESARDRAKLREVWQNQRPIAFTKTSKSRIPTVSNSQSPPTPKIVAFTKVTQRRPNGLSQQHSHSDPTERPGSQRSEASNENWRPSSEVKYNEDRPLKPLPVNARVERNLNFSRAHGFPIHRAALTEQNLEQQNRIGRAEPSTSSVPSSQDSHAARQPSGPIQSIEQRLKSTYGPGHHDPAQRNQNSPMSIGKTKPEDGSKTEDTSQVDWAVAAADIPLPSLEASSSPQADSLTPQSTQKHPSPDKSRRWDNDFTGQSFQVSESPPVRNKIQTSDYTLDKEIQNLTKKALATSRLGELREKQSREQLGGGSRLLNHSSVPASSDSQSVSAASEKEIPNISDGEAIPNTPVVIFRSSSQSTSDRNLGEQNKERDASHDFLQRFARAASATPKSSPPSTNDVGKQEREHQRSSAERDTNSGKPIVQDMPATEEGRGKQSYIPAEPPIAQTPKVVGAWTDTILPDTVKTVRWDEQQMKHAQTPHINAGGWVDTPGGAEQKHASIEMTPIIEEVPEELTNGITKESDTKNPVERDVPTQSSGQQLEKHPNSGLATILDRAKQRLVSQDITTAPREDTLNLGNDTIESLEDLLALDADDLTALSRFSFLEEGETRVVDEDEAEAAVLERLGLKLDRLRNNIHDARKGISKLEHQVAGTDKQSLSGHLSNSVCTMCQSTPTTEMVPHSHISGTKTARFLPRANLRLSIPIPLLFYPRASNSKSRFPRPTPLGWVTITFWLWYLFETTLCEIYCRPLYAEHYDWPAMPEPEFPLVIPTMLYRWTRLQHIELFSSYIWALAQRFFVAIWRISGMTFGWSDGFVDPTGTGVVGTATKQILETVAAAAAAASSHLGGPDLSMMDDEFL